MEYIGVNGVPKFVSQEFHEKSARYCLCIPVINEGNRILKELQKSFSLGINKIVDIIICDGDSSDGSTDLNILKQLGVNSLLVKKDSGKQGAQLRMGFWWALNRGYDGIITIDGNNKDSIEDVTKFIKKLEEGYDFIQGSRFIKGGRAINTPLIRYLSVRLIHAPIISMTARHYFTDTTNAFRGYSKKYLLHEDVKPFRDIFQTYELLAYLSTKASQLKMRVCEIPVTREYPFKVKTPTKITAIKGNSNLLKILLKNTLGCYNYKKPKEKK